MLIILIGASGSGKTSIEKKLEQYGIRRLRSYTTRVRRSGEEADAYYFVKKEDFKKIDIVESVLYNNSFFGLSRTELAIAETAHCVVTLDCSGIGQIKRLFPSAITVYINCPIYQLKKRLPIEMDQQKQLKQLGQIESDTKCAFDCDYIVNNYDQQLDEAVSQILKIYSAHQVASIID